jgi:hypothetical protein
MMRHKRIETTLRYYVMEEAENLAAEIWGAVDDVRIALPGRRTTAPLV